VQQHNEFPAMTQLLREQRERRQAERTVRDIRQLTALVEAANNALAQIKRRGSADEATWGFVAKAGYDVFEADEILDAYSCEIAAADEELEREAEIEAREREMLASDYRWGCRS